ncbi:Flotillin family [Trema orientale]|uniref:Flotillin-like n=1 Tax=Trema orientale TaxID=63057 RepID=A0A2P5BKG7_TREOI|nr:Flotillin family [Trema orientale]
MKQFLHVATLFSSMLINTAQAKARGEVGAKQCEAEILQNAATVDSEIRRMQLDAKKQEIKARTELKSLENENEAQLLESVMALAEKTKSAQLAKVRARHEVEREEASARYALELQEADLEMKKKQKEAEADLKKQKEAEADLYKSCLAAQALEKSSAAEGLYLKTLMQELHGDYAAIRDYLMIKHNIFQEMAKVNAKAINGLQPKISIWSTKPGDNGDENASGMKDVASVFSTIPPLFKTVKEQICMIPATWPGSSPD